MLVMSAYGYKRTYSGQLANVRFTPKSGHKWLWRGMSAYDPKRPLPGEFRGSDLFLTEGRIVSTRGRHPDSHQQFDAEAEDFADGYPVVVVLDGNSASASEIVAAALQGTGRAVLVGSNSFGKGTARPRVAHHQPLVIRAAPP